MGPPDDSRLIFAHRFQLAVRSPSEILLITAGESYPGFAMRTATSARSAGSIDESTAADCAGLRWDKNQRHRLRMFAAHEARQQLRVHALQFMGCANLARMREVAPGASCFPRDRTRW